MLGILTLVHRINTVVTPQANPPLLSEGMGQHSRKKLTLLQCAHRKCNFNFNLSISLLFLNFIF